MKQTIPSIYVNFLIWWKGRVGMYNVVAEKHAVLVFTSWKFPEEAYPQDGGNEIDGHYNCADVLESCREVRA
jgi:hypothetical protein